MMTPEWWKKNLGGIMLASFASVCVYSLGSYISSSITKEMKNYLPLSVWHQWAQEREEWRGRTDQQIAGLKDEMSKQRTDMLVELRDMVKEQTRQTTILEDLKGSFQRHEALDNERLMRLGTPQRSPALPAPKTVP